MPNEWGRGLWNGSYFRLHPIGPSIWIRCCDVDIFWMSKSWYSVPRSTSDHVQYLWTLWLTFLQRTHYRLTTEIHFANQTYTLLLDLFCLSPGCRMSVKSSASETPWEDGPLHEDHPRRSVIASPRYTIFREHNGAEWQLHKIRILPYHIWNVVTTRPSTCAVWNTWSHMFSRCLGVNSGERRSSGDIKYNERHMVRITRENNEVVEK